MRTVLGDIVVDGNLLVEILVVARYHLSARVAVQARAMTLAMWCVLIFVVSFMGGAIGATL